jgi:N utilization substance protein A
VLDVDKDQKGCTILLSRTHPNFLVRLFEVEVPEMQEGIIKVIGAAREPGERAKISVYSGDTSIDPIGACVGVKGSRVQAVVQELRGEKIDIIPWSKDSAKFACNALAPARVSKVYINEEDTSMEIVVNDDQLSLAIGKKGQNVRLASRLTGWKIDIKSEAEVEKTSRKVIDDLMENLKVNEIMARVLFDEYLREGRDIGRLTPEEMAKVTRISVEDCSAIIEKAKVWAETSEKQAAELAALEAQAKEAQAQEAEEKAKEEAEEAGQTSATTEQAPTEG